MTDRELLKLAAKAVGAPGVPGLGDDDWEVIGWNPLTDDGDALRLSVKCALLIKHFVGSVVVGGVAGLARIVEVREMHADHDGDMCAATRRAIVRAAAEIGKTMA